MEDLVLEEVLVPGVEEATGIDKEVEEEASEGASMAMETSPAWQTPSETSPRTFSAASMTDSVIARTCPGTKWSSKTGEAAVQRGRRRKTSGEIVTIIYKII